MFSYQSSSSARGQVVDLGHIDVLGAHPGLLVRPQRDRVTEARAVRFPRIGGEVRHLDDGIRERGGHGGDGIDADQRGAGLAEATLAGVLHAREHEGGGTVGGGANVQQPQRIADHRRREHVLDRDLGAVAGIGVLHAVQRVLHLDLREVHLRWRRRAPSGGARRARSTPGSRRRRAGSAASPGRPCAHRRRARRSPWAWCRHRRRGRHHTARRGSAPARSRWQLPHWRRRRTNSTRSPRSSPAPARRSCPRRSPG